MTVGQTYMAKVFQTEKTKIKVLIFGHKEFSHLMSSMLPTGQSETEFKIVDSIVGSVAEAEQQIDKYQPDVVVSGGSNAAYLKASLAIPVLSLTVTNEDVIEAIQRAATVGNNIVLISFDDYSSIVPLLETSLNIKIEQKKYQTSDQAREMFHIASRKKDAVIVGASLVCGLATQANIPSFMFYSSKSCALVIEQAVQQAIIHRSQKKQHALTHWLLNQSKTPIIMTDVSGGSITLNLAARKELNLSPDYEIDLEELIHPQETQRPTDGECSINGNDWWFHQDKVVSGGEIVHVYQLYRKKLDIDLAQIENDNKHQLTYQSKAIGNVMKQVKSFSSSPSNVLINGESGTGKELIARAVYQHSPFSKGHFVALNCSAIPTELFEGELFGHQDGAYTGSRRGGRKGLIEEAKNGVLFLDEISELALDQQAKLLRFLQERRYRPLGSNEERPITLKLVAASNKNLKEMVEKGLFREDLYFRLNVFNINIPPLRMRPEDILCIAQTKLSDFIIAYGSNLEPLNVLNPIKTALTNYSWPGNVRELENILERIIASLHMSGDIESVESSLREIAPELFFEAKLDSQQSLVKNKERELVADAMLKFSGDKQKVAEYLGMSQTTLWRRLKHNN
jgi:propionate catabolism operon transcriptional regulator